MRNKKDWSGSMSTVTGRKTWRSVGLRGVVPLQFFGGISSDFSCMPFQAKETVKATHDLTIAFFSCRPPGHPATRPPGHPATRPPGHRPTRPPAHTATRPQGHPATRPWAAQPADHPPPGQPRQTSRRVLGAVEAALAMEAGWLN